MNINIATINIRGIRTPDKINYLWDFIKKNKLDIIALQEVNTPEIENPTNEYQIEINFNHETPEAAQQ